MKKVNLNNLVEKQHFIETAVDRIRNINGGCTIKLGCNTNGYYTISYNYKCTNATAHTKAALNYANTYNPGPGLYQVTGKSSVTYLG